MRTRRSFERPEGIRSAKLIVIASEGRKTESIYFEALRDTVALSNVIIKVLKRDNNQSSPADVLAQLKDFKSQYSLEGDDELWMVIDRDKWTDKMLADVARQCMQDRYLHIALSNPCFELWLLLHLEDVTSMNDEEKIKLRENKRESKNGDPWLKKRLRLRMGSYQESNYDTSLLLPHVERARKRAKELDSIKSHRWPQEIGTRVYRIIDSIHFANYNKENDLKKTRSLKIISPINT